MLTKIQHNQCTSSPTVLNPPKNVPKFLNLVPLLVDGVVYNSKCPDVALFAPCTCSIPKGDQVITTTCPFGSSILEIMNAFSNFPYSPDLNTVSNIGNVVIYFPPLIATVIPLTFIGNNEAATIKLIGPTAKALSKLTMEINFPFLPFQAKSAFDSQLVTDFSIENFDVNDLDYGFLANFKFLTSITINKCTNAPSKAKPPLNLPITNLMNLKTISVDGTNIFTPKRR